MATTAILSAQADIRVSSDATPQLEPASADLGYEVMDEFDDDSESTEVITQAIGKPKRNKVNSSHHKLILAFAVGACLAAATVYALTSGTTKTDATATPTAPSQPQDENERRPGPEFHRPGEPWLDAEGRPIPPPPRPPFPNPPPGKGWPPPPRP